MILFSFRECLVILDIVSETIFILLTFLNNKYKSYVDNFLFFFHHWIWFHNALSKIKSMPSIWLSFVICLFCSGSFQKCHSCARCCIASVDCVYVWMLEQVRVHFRSEGSCFSSVLEKFKRLSFQMLPLSLCQCPLLGECFSVSAHPLHFSASWCSFFLWTGFWASFSLCSPFQPFCSCSDVFVNRISYISL